MPIATKLTLSYLLVITISTIAFSVIGTHLIGQQIVSEAETAVRNDLNAAREILLGRLDDVNDVVRLTVDRVAVRAALREGNGALAAPELFKIRETERLDFLTLTDATGRVLLRTSNPAAAGDVRTDELLSAVRASKAAAAAVMIMPAEDLRRESPELARRAYLRFIDTPKARPRRETEETAGMVIEAAAPILGDRRQVLGVLYGGLLLNRDFSIVDKIKRTVFRDVKYNGQDIGTATIMLDDVRIATNVLTRDGSRAIGTRVAEDVYEQVVGQGKPWVGRAFVVNNWYITAYEPIRSITGQIVGILYVGVLEQKYVDVRRRTVAALLGLTLAGGLVAMALSYHMSRRISGTIMRLVSASKDMALGNLDVQVRINTNDELEDLAEAFNTMASSLRRREELVKEYARSRIMESERLAITGQLAAGIAHELNNPLQGIVTYSHLLLERQPADGPMRASLQKIVNQAERCREIVRGLLDFSRPRTPQMKLTSVNALIQECLALVERQALFHNIQITTAFQKDLPPSLLDPSLMQQVFMNIIMNAAEAMDGHGQLTVVTRLDASQNFIEIEFTDTGHGIRPEDMERIFDPFFTTKAPGHGTGLGLAISQGIVQKHRGTISVSSQVGQGTTFVIRLPMTTEGDV
ncbi:MAG: cache domain-containing protein [Armatimonadota bacterium]|nr:cache domain-containing protein [Armatimonadota bacterium]